MRKIKEKGIVKAKGKNDRSTEYFLLKTAFAIRIHNPRAARELVRTIYLYHGWFNVYFTTYNIVLKKFDHLTNMFLKKVLNDMRLDGLVKQVAGTGLETRVYSLTEKGKERADELCRMLEIKPFRKP